jgi:3-hydroxy-3-methylglutaryl CoA synthase
LKDSNAVGNTYTASVFYGLASLIDRVSFPEKSLITMFSYRSGVLATMYALQVEVITIQSVSHFLFYLF